MAWRRRDQEELRSAIPELMAASNSREVADALLPHVAKVIGGQGAALVDQGSVIGSHGVTPELLSDAELAEDQDGLSHSPLGGQRIALRLRHGRLMAWGSSYSPFFGPDELELLGSIGSVADLALERCDLFQRELQARISFEQANKFSEGIIASSVDGILAFDRKYRYTLWNPGMERITGVVKDRVLGCCAFDVFPFLKEIGEDRFFQAALEGETKVAENRPYVVSETDKAGFFAANYSPLYGEEGAIIGGLAVVRDITERKQREEDLRKQSDTLREQAELLDHAHDAILVRDVDERIVFWNKGAERTYGWTKEEALGHSPHSLLKLRSPKPSAKSEGDFDPEGKWEGELEHISKGGRVVIVASRQVLVRDQSGAPRAVLEINRDVTLRKLAEREARENKAKALHDPLTGLANRAFFLEHLDTTLSKCDRTGNQVALLFVDVDYFKDVNDRLGHTAGDHVLRTVARQLKRAVRPSDVVARFGGDEFTIVCDDMSSEGAVVLIARRIAEALKGPHDIDGHEQSFTASIGITMSRTGVSVSSLLEEADAALYQAKNRGRACYEVFDKHLRQSLARRTELENALGRAVEANEFVIQYQPQIDLRTGSVVGVEALVRWEHPVQGLLPPAHFIPLAEETGLITPLGSWVLRESLSQAAIWNQTRSEHGLVVSVNLSALQLNQPDLADMIFQTLCDTGVDPSTLCLEITESALIKDIEKAEGTLERFKSLGVRLSIDDFGTGYSSLSYLKRFPIDTLKVDKSFVKDIANGQQERAVAKSVIELAHALELTAIAEGVEQVGQVEELQCLGCDFAQGYYFAPPTDPQEIDLAVQETLS
jgi:diguanylate cyclase (GGDEF)-like protein/PAS domain S-box-containing protein